jgi:glycolate oxidase
VKYGVTGRYVLGLELVLPTGDIVALGGKRVKDVTGYDLKQLIVGSEGTLGIITKIVVKLLPLPSSRTDLLVLFRDVKSAIGMVPRIMTEARIVPTSLEFMDRLSVDTACRYLNEHIPREEAGAMLLIELDGNDAERLESEAETVGELCFEGGAIEVYVADNANTQERVWGLRRSIPEAFKAYGPHQSIEDIVVPVAAIPDLMPELERVSGERGVRIPCYGHAGDGNMHATLIKNPDTTVEEWSHIEHETLKEIYGVVKKLGGTISGEHGIGSKRKRYFIEDAASPALLSLMSRIKKAFDPNRIMNPGKIFDPE